MQDRKQRIEEKLLRDEVETDLEHHDLVFPFVAQFQPPALCVHVGVELFRQRRHIAGALYLPRELQVLLLRWIRHPQHIIHQTFILVLALSFVSSGHMPFFAMVRIILFASHRRFQRFRKLM